MGNSFFTEKIGRPRPGTLLGHKPGEIGNNQYDLANNQDPFTIPFDDPEKKQLTAGWDKGFIHIVQS